MAQDPSAETVRNRTFCLSLNITGDMIGHDIIMLLLRQDTVSGQAACQATSYPGGLQNKADSTVDHAPGTAGFSVRNGHISTISRH